MADDSTACTCGHIRPPPGGWGFNGGVAVHGRSHVESDGSSRSSPNTAEAKRQRPTLPSQVIRVLSSFPELLNLTFSNNDQVMQSINQILIRSLSDREWRYSDYCADCLFFLNGIVTCHVNLIKQTSLTN